MEETRKRIPRILFLTIPCESIIIVKFLKGQVGNRKRGRSRKGEKDRQEGRQQSNWAGLVDLIKYTDLLEQCKPIKILQDGEVTYSDLHF